MSELAAQNIVDKVSTITQTYFSDIKKELKKISDHTSALTQSFNELKATLLSELSLASAENTVLIEKVNQLVKTSCGEMKTAKRIPPKVVEVPKLLQKENPLTKDYKNYMAWTKAMWINKEDFRNEWLGDAANLETLNNDVMVKNKKGVDRLRSEAIVMWRDIFTDAQKAILKTRFMEYQSSLQSQKVMAKPQLDVADEHGLADEFTDIVEDIGKDYSGF